MKKVRWGIPRNLLLTATLLLQTSLGFAQETINVSLVLDPSLSCSQPVIDFAVTAKSTLGFSPGSCSSNRSSGTGGANSNETNQFNRIIGIWRYAPRGVFKDGLFFMTAVGIENDNFSTTAGSTADVLFFGSSVHTGYQWFWKNGFNITFIVSASHLARVSLNNYKIAPTESNDVINWLDTNTSTNTHYSAGPLFGWAF